MSKYILASKTLYFDSQNVYVLTSEMGTGAKFYPGMFPAFLEVPKQRNPLLSPLFHL